ncbi:MAG: TonB-dependent receptor [Gemmatimonadaceae bacterium]
MALRPQGVTSAAIVGTVVIDGAAGTSGARVRVTNRVTGHQIETTVRNGRFALPGLEVGGPYTVLVRQLGYEPQTRDGLLLSLGERRELHFELSHGTRTLDTVRTTASGVTIARARSGVGATISDSALRRLPSRDRNVYDFVQLIPSVTTRFGISGGGVNFRFNSVLVDGVSERALQGALPAGGQSGGKSVSIEAVKEYQVLLSPYDARYGDFAGTLVNAVSKGGANELHGTAYGFARSDALARRTPFLRDAPYERTQFGFTLGGPIVRDRAHFFVAQELQRLVGPAPGPWLGQAPADQAPVLAQDARRFAEILQTHGLTAGSAEQIRISNPLINLFARLDVLAPEWRSRFMLRHNYNRVHADRFTRPLSGAVFPLSSYAWTQQITKRATLAQVVTHVGRGGLNELRIAYTELPQRGVSGVRQPVVVVRVPAADGTRLSALQAGTNEFAQGQELQQTNAEVRDDFLLPLGTRHTLSLGASVDVFRLQVHGGTAGGYGRWEFSSLDSLERGVAARYSLAKDLGGADAPLTGTQFALYAGDEWRLTNRVTMTYGMRADVLALRGHPPFSPDVASTYGRRTDVIPASQVAWSPRIGFEWKTGNTHQVRGGVGLFAGRPPLGWLHSAFREYGAGVANLSCGSRRTDLGPPPPFVARVQAQPVTCKNGIGFDDTAQGAVTLLAPKLSFARTLRTSMAFEWTLPGGVLGGVEGLLTKNVGDFLFVNANLAGPVGVDRRGRVMYGSVAPSGQAAPRLVADRNSDVIDLRDQSQNYSYQLSARAEKKIGSSLEITAAYAFARVRDVQSQLSGFQAASNWRDGRVMSGRHESLETEVSAFEVPHRVVLAMLFASSWRRWATDLSLYYIGESGSPFTYLAFGASGLGDLNADGTNANDPIYVPTSALDDREIRFTGLSASAGDDSSPAAQLRRVAEQQAAFERFIEGSACLRRQRGQIVARNSCRTPAVHTANLAVRQSVPLRTGHSLSVQLEVFNVLNLLDAHLGLLKTPNAAVLEHVGQTSADALGSEPVYRFSRTHQRFDWHNIESAYQFQLAVRYSF